MATLAESFLADLDELEEDEEDPEQQQQQKEEDLKNEMDVEGDLPEGLQFDDLHAVAKLYSSSRFQETVKRVRETDAGDESGNVVVNDEEHYKLIIDCNTLTVDIDNEIVVVHNFIRDKYRAKFPELESLVLNPLDYARVVRAIGNEMDMTLVDLSGLLPSATIMVVTVTGSTTNGKELSDNELQKVLEACDMALELDESKKLIFTFLESQMSRIAPNLSAVCGSTIAARLLGIAGGLRALAAMPACNIQVLGQRKKNLAGFSSATQQPHQGIIAQTEVVTQTPPAWKTKAIRLMANQCALMSRVDNFGEDPSGAKGKATLEEVKQKIEKWQEAPPAKTAKPLPVPDAEKKKRRGGKRLRKMKERYGMSDMAKQANRMKFGEKEEETMTGEGLGMIGQGGVGGRLRILPRESKLALKAQKKFKTTSYGSSGQTNGISSSLAFTPVQGIELENPNKIANAMPGDVSGYFSEVAGFSRVRKLGVSLGSKPSS